MVRRKQKHCAPQQMVRAPAPIGLLSHVSTPLRFGLFHPLTCMIGSSCSEEVKSTCVEALSFFLGTCVPTPKRVFRSKWRSSQCFRGSYSFVQVGSSGEDIDAIAAPLAFGSGGGLLFAGEHTHRYCYSTMHAAHLTGVRAADLITASSLRPAGSRAPEASSGVS